MIQFTNLLCLFFIFCLPLLECKLHGGRDFYFWSPIYPVHLGQCQLVANTDGRITPLPLGAFYTGHVAGHQSPVDPYDSVMPDSLQPHGLQPARLLCPWGFSRQEYWSGLPCPPSGDLPNLGMEPRSPALQAGSLPAKPPGKSRKEITAFK